MSRIVALFLVSVLPALLSCGHEPQPISIVDAPATIELPRGEKTVAVEFWQGGVYVTTRHFQYYEDADTLNVWRYEPRRILIDGSEHEFVATRKYRIYEAK